MSRFGAERVEIRWYVDGVHFHTVNIKYVSKSELHTPQYIILNLAVGGSWPGKPRRNTPFPSQYLIDWVSVYQQQ